MMLAGGSCVLRSAPKCARRLLCCDGPKPPQLESVVRLPGLRDDEVYNEPILTYRANSIEREQLKCEIEKISNTIEDVPIVIGDQEIREGHSCYQVMPHRHRHRIAKFYHASKGTIKYAIETATKAQKKWDRVPLEKRASIWRRAAELMAGRRRQSLNAATMMGQSKTVIQAEIDAACELIDFFRFNLHFLKENAKYQPISKDRSECINSMRFRGIDGFIAAISPFNFTAIGGNLAYTPALMGNSVVWKPSDTAVLSNWRIFTILREAGMPPGVVNFVPADGPTFGATVTRSPHLAGINFTGSVPTFNWLWRNVGENLDKYRNYPRLVGECGGKNYHLVHPSADPRSVVCATIRSAFEYCGQKCSACSRLYVPRSLRKVVVAGLLTERDKLSAGDVSHFCVFNGAVIDGAAFNRMCGYIAYAQSNPKSIRILAGGALDYSEGYFVHPTIIEVKDPRDRLMTDEIFGPILTIYTFDDCDLDRTMRMLAESTKYALTGAIFGCDQGWLKYAYEKLRMSAGNFYINDKSTGSVVGQQPFGGGRMSGTNDKAGGPGYVLRWTSPQTIKETFVPLRDIDYPYMND